MYVCRKMNNSQARTGHQRGMGGRETDDDDTHERHKDTNRLTRHTELTGSLASSVLFYSYFFFLAAQPPHSYVLVPACARPRRRPYNISTSSSAAAILGARAGAQLRARRGLGKRVLFRLPPRASVGRGVCRPPAGPVGAVGALPRAARAHRLRRHRRSDPPLCRRREAAGRGGAAARLPGGSAAGRAVARGAARAAGSLDHEW